MSQFAGSSHTGISSIDHIVREITNSRDDEALNEILKSCVKETNDTLLSKMLYFDNEDLLDVLVVPGNTLGMLYIL